MANEEGQGEETGYVSKVTLKVLGCDPKEAVVQKKEVALARIYGIAQGVKYVPNRQTGDTSVALMGDFEGVNLLTGVVLRAGVCYLPAGIHDTIVAPLEAQRKAEGGVNPIEFGVELRAYPSANPVGYSYKAYPFVKPEAVDPMIKFRQAMAALTHQPPKKLEAPKEPAKAGAKK